MICMNTAHYKEIYNAWFRNKRRRHLALVVAWVVVLVLFFYTVLFSAPVHFPQASLFKVKSGMTLQEIGASLQQRNMVRFAGVFTITARLEGGNKHIVAGEYLFSDSENIFTMVNRMLHGDYGITPVRVTFTEGISSKEMADQLAKEVPDFDVGTFLVEAQKKEGYLLPDTYFILPGADPETVMSLLEHNFNSHINDLSVVQTVARSGNTLSDIVTMASLVEKEASDTTDRRIVAGILWNRVRIGMPLQVDSVFPYIIGKYSLQLTLADLQTSSPYNTYTNKGLPPGPISNPSMDAILASANPLHTPYLYYLSDKKGVIHYAATYAEHLANKRKYL